MYLIFNADDEKPAPKQPTPGGGRKDLDTV
jgi:hypothetical protein